MSLTYGFCLDDIGTEYNSAQFSDAFHTLVGNGITPYGSRFALTLNGFTATLASGYSLTAGRWLKNDEPLAVSVPLSGNNKDRMDALVVRVDYAEKKAELEVLIDVDASAIRADPSFLRNAQEYNCFLYLIRVRRGATSLSMSDVTDLREDAKLCGKITPMSEISASVLYIYRFFTSGLDKEVDRLIGLSNQVIQKADREIKRISSEIQEKGGAANIGDLMTARKHPSPVTEWLLCDGGSVPAGYPVLSDILKGTLPKIHCSDKRFSTYIYGGTPEEVQ